MLFASSHPFEFIVLSITLLKECLNTDGQQFLPYKKSEQCEESSNTDGQQFHQFKQNEQSPLPSTHCYE